MLNDCVLKINWQSQVLPSKCRVHREFEFFTMQASYARVELCKGENLGFLSKLCDCIGPFRRVLPRKSDALVST
jgi:hypothetical protein